MKLNIQLFGGRGAGSNKELNYYKNLKKMQQERLKNVSKDADVTRDAIKNAIKYADDKIKELSNKSITKGDYTYTKNGANMTVKVLDVSGDKVLIRASGKGPNGGFFDGSPQTASINSPLIKGMIKKRK